MGYTASGGPKGLGVITDSNTPLSDFTKMIELIARVGNYRGAVTEAERDAITGAALYTGLLVFNTDADALELWDGSGWVKVWAQATAPGSVTPTAGSGFTLSNNFLFTRNGRLLGSIDWSKGSALAHSDVILTLPVGVRPSYDSNADAVSAPSPAVLHQVSVTSLGAVTAISPPAGRTSGTIRFDVPIPL